MNEFYAYEYEQANKKKQESSKKYTEKNNRSNKNKTVKKRSE